MADETVLWEQVFPTGVGMSRQLVIHRAASVRFPYRRRDEPWEEEHGTEGVKFSLQA